MRVRIRGNDAPERIAQGWRSSERIPFPVLLGRAQMKRYAGYEIPADPGLQHAYSIDGSTIGRSRHATILQHRLARKLFPSLEMTAMKLNGQRLWQSLMDLAKIGATPKGGVCRLALTDRDREGRDVVCAWLRETGCTISIDAIGNIFARRGGRRNDLPPIVASRHDWREATSTPSPPAASSTATMGCSLRSR